MLRYPRLLDALINTSSSSGDCLRCGSRYRYDQKKVSAYLSFIATAAVCHTVIHAKRCSQSYQDDRETIACKSFSICGHTLFCIENAHGHQRCRLVHSLHEERAYQRIVPRWSLLIGVNRHRAYVRRRCHPVILTNMIVRHRRSGGCYIAEVAALSTVHPQVYGVATLDLPYMNVFRLCASDTVS